MARDVEGATLCDAFGEMFFDRDLGQPALLADFFDGQAFVVEIVGFINRAGGFRFGL